MLAELGLKLADRIGETVAVFDRGLTVLSGESRRDANTILGLGLQLLAGEWAEQKLLPAGVGHASVHARFTTAGLDGQTVANIVELLRSCGAVTDSDEA